MKISIIGTGVQGSGIALILATKAPEVSEIVCADIDYSRAERAVQKIGDARLRAEKVDASDPQDLLRVLEGSNVAINAALPKFDRTIMDSALKSGAHYVGLAADDPEGALEFARAWEEAGLTAVLYQGGPYVMNCLVRKAADEMDSVEEIRLRYGGKPLKKKEPIEVWAPEWSPEIALTEWLHEPAIYDNGTYKWVPPFSGIEKYRFPDPVGRVEICFIDYEPTYTLPRFIGKGTKHVDCKIMVDKLAGTLIKMGLASDKPIKVKGVEVAPIDVLLAVVPQPADILIELLAKPEDASKFPVPSEANILYCFLAEVKGRKGGKKVTRTFYRTSSALEDFRKYGTPWAAVVVPPALTAVMLASGEIETKGIIAPECLDPNKFLKRLADWGMIFQEKPASRQREKTQ